MRCYEPRGHWPVATNQTARTSGLRPSGAVIGPSRIYFFPNGVSTAEAIGAERAWSSSASCNFGHTAAVNPKREESCLPAGGGMAARQQIIDNLAAIDCC